jgi:hypothetical protein
MSMPLRANFAAASDFSFGLQDVVCN